MASTYDIVFRVVNLVAAVFLVIGGVAFILQGGFPNFITAVFCILFGIMTGLFEFKLPKSIIQFASFMFSLLGRGMFYIFLGCIILNYNSLSLACGVIIILIGVVYSICHFIPQIEPPSNMRPSTFEQTLGMNHQDTHPYHTPSPSSFHSHHINSSMSPPPPQPTQETTPYPQKTYIPNESHIP
ncbi:COPI associated protein-domain-containing protein [Chlamydoabsidia padenii]|nr:COPI associated protein-domain-containing protein [Chlamydoabsidia padenii]